MAGGGCSSGGVNTNMFTPQPYIMPSLPSAYMGTLMEECITQLAEAGEDSTCMCTCGATETEGEAGVQM